MPSPRHHECYFFRNIIEFQKIKEWIKYINYDVNMNCKTITIFFMKKNTLNRNTIFQIKFA